MRIAIMQPTFVPWIGYFSMIDYVDLFVFLDDVQFVKRSWQCRNRIKSQAGSTWISLTMDGAQSRPLIMDARIVSNGFPKIVNQVTSCLGKAPYFNQLDILLNSMISDQTEALGNFNARLIKETCGLLSIDTDFIFSSSLKINSSTKSSRLLDICSALGGTEYISPQGSFDYLHDDNPFGNVDLKFFDFEHPRYPQLFGDFEPFLSMLDVIANIGAEASYDLLRNGAKNPLSMQEIQERLAC